MTRNTFTFEYHSFFPLYKYFKISDTDILISSLVLTIRPNKKNDVVPVTRPTLDLWCVSGLFFIIFSSSRATKLKKDHISSSIIKRNRFFVFLGCFSAKIGKKILQKKKIPYLPTLFFSRQVTGTTPIFLFGLRYSHIS